MAKISDKQYIIAIGASAGGLEAISAFFDYTPLDAVSYVIIQHLSADFKSQMAQILDKHTQLQILEATDNMEVGSNKVYLIPSAKFMSIKGGRLMLSDKKDKRPPHMTIDWFLSSLAEERGDKAIAVILSGTGNDGSKGIEAVKSAGGAVLIQDPETAGFDGMPIAAIVTGCADAVLSPKEMPKAIENYVSSGALEMLTGFNDHDINATELTDIITLIKGSLPFDFTDYKRPTILRRIKRRMVHNNFTRVDKYYNYLKTNADEIELLANDFLICVTSFFRDLQAFKIIEKIVIPELIRHKSKDDTLKIWVAGCASGEEAYSLAILVKEYFIRTNTYLDVKIFATDINKSALNTAAKGIYGNNIEKSVSAERLKLFFDKNGRGYKIRNDIRKMLIFAQHDLVKNPPYCNVDMISCRNLLIYMNAVLQKKVFAMMHFGLRKDGYLFLGPSESAAVLKGDFDEISNKWNILKSNKRSRTVRFDSFESPIVEGLKTPASEVYKKPETFPAKLSVTDQLYIAICEESGLSGVYTDRNLKVLRSFGNLSPYLKNERFNFNLTELLPDAIAIPVKAAAHKAIKIDRNVQLNGIVFSSPENVRSHLVDIVVKPLLVGGSVEKDVLILFKEKKTNKKTNTRIADIQSLASEHLISLERELAETRRSLEEAYERIESSNENMQSFNEELLSANEEMQSSNEELQSVNEELQTINKEHQAANVALSEMNDDLNNYFRSNVNGQLFVDRNLLLKKYSPGAIRHINIRESDIGRPLSNITTNIKFETLISDIEKVISEDGTVVREAESLDGKIYQVMTMPYVRTSDGKTDGAIISFYDITELKQVLQHLDKSNKSLLRINGDLNNFVYGASHDLSAPILNIEAVIGLLNRKIDMQNPEVLNLSEIIKRSLINVKAVISDLAKVGTIEADMLENGDMESFQDKFSAITAIISEQIKQSEATFSVDFQVEAVRFPKKNLRSIILNLITNAIKFRSAERSPHIALKTERVDGFIILSVTDNGIGISADRIDYIFKMYQRLNIDIEGQGIGLFLVKKIMDASGGTIEVESEVGVGSTFRIFFKA